MKHHFKILYTVTGALLLLASIPCASFASHLFTINMDIVTNYPGITYNAARASLRSILPGGARWGVVGLWENTNVTGRINPQMEDTTYVISFTTMTNYYVPAQIEFALFINTNFTRYYIPYSNTLSITASGPEKH